MSTAIGKMFILNCVLLLKRILTTSEIVTDSCVTPALIGKTSDLYSSHMSHVDPYWTSSVLTAWYL